MSHIVHANCLAWPKVPGKHILSRQYIPELRAVLVSRQGPDLYVECVTFGWLRPGKCPNRSARVLTGLLF